MEELAMSKKNNKNKNDNSHNYPFSNEIKKFKEEFKQFIDTMSDEEFMDMMSILMLDFEDFENLEDFWNYDEEWEDEAEEFYSSNNNTESNNLFNDDTLPF